MRIIKQIFSQPQNPFSIFSNYFFLYNSNISDLLLNDNFKYSAKFACSLAILLSRTHFLSLIYSNKILCSHSSFTQNWSRVVQSQNPWGRNRRTQAVSKEENNTSRGPWHISLAAIEIDELLCWRSASSKFGYTAVINHINMECISFD